MISPGKGLSRVRIARLDDGHLADRMDVVTVEEPLEIRVEFTRNGARETSAVSVTMRTPGDDFELAAGFLYGEGLVRRREDVAEISYCQTDEPQTYNIVVVKLRPGAPFDPDALSRNFYMSSSCGVCGKASSGGGGGPRVRADPGRGPEPGPGDSEWPAGEAPSRAGALRPDGRHPRSGPLRRIRQTHLGARGRGAAQCRRQGRGSGFSGR